MNANELADELEDKDRLWNVDEKLMIETCAMLRQQQAEIEALKCHCGRPLFETQDIIHTKTECLMRKAQEK